MQGCRRSWEDKQKCVKILSFKDHNSTNICQSWIISPHALLDLWCYIPAKFHSNPWNFKGCWRSWEDKLKCVKILSVKCHNSAKICRTWNISLHALLDLWCNIPAKFHSNPCKDVGGVEKTKKKTSHTDIEWIFHIKFQIQWGVITTEVNIKPWDDTSHWFS